MKKNLIYASAIVIGMTGITSCNKSGGNNNPNAAETIQNEQKAEEEPKKGVEQAEVQSKQESKKENEEKNKVQGESDQANAKKIDVSMLEPLKDCPSTIENIQLNYVPYLDDHAIKNNLPAYLQTKKALNPALDKNAIKRSETFVTTCLNNSKRQDAYDPNNIFSVEFFKHSSKTLADAMIISFPSPVQLKLYNFSYPPNIEIKNKSNQNVVLEKVKDIKESEVSILTYSVFFDKQLTFGHNPVNEKRTPFNENIEFFAVNSANKPFYKIQITRKNASTKDNSKEIELCIYGKNSESKALGSCFKQNFVK